MIDFDLNGVVVRVKNNALGDMGDIDIAGKTLVEWAGSALDNNYKVIESAQVINACPALRSVVDRQKPVTAVLFCDTPLVTAATVKAAVKKLTETKAKIVRLPRGFILRTETVFEADSIFLQVQPQSEGEFRTVSDAQSLCAVQDIVRDRILKYHASNGVIIKDFRNTYIDCDVMISRGAVIEPYNFIKGKTVIKDGAVIMPGNYIDSCLIGRGARIDSSRLYGSSVGDGTTVGPFAYIRPDTVIGKGCRIGDFVELKSSVIGDGTKVSHLTYIGDAQLGKECNVGCGVVFANYDGKNKYRSVVGDRVFIGSNANIVAPVTIDSRAFIAAGSTVTKSVPGQALVVARSRERIIENWAGNVYAPPPGSAAGVKAADDGVIDGSGGSNG